MTTNEPTTSLRPPIWRSWQSSVTRCFPQLFKVVCLQRLADCSFVTRCCQRRVCNSSYGPSGAGCRGDGADRIRMLLEWNPFLCTACLLFVCTAAHLQYKFHNIWRLGRTPSIASAEAWYGKDSRSGEVLESKGRYTPRIWCGHTAGAIPVGPFGGEGNDEEGRRVRKQPRDLCRKKRDLDEWHNL